MNRPLTIEKRGELIYISNGVSYIYIDKELLKKLIEMLDYKDERIGKAIEWIDWFRKDNKEFYKNKIGLTMAELDGLENILKGDSDE